jgi:hypothetical protein
MSYRFAVAALGILVSSACPAPETGAPDGETTSDFTPSISASGFFGEALALVDPIAFQEDNNPSFLYVTASETRGSCDDRPRRAGDGNALIVLRQEDGFVPGLYDVCPTLDCGPAVASVVFFRNNEICDPRDPISIGTIVSGDVTVEEVDFGDGGRVRGSFDVQDQDGSRITGSFGAPVCSQPPASTTCTN